MIVVDVQVEIEIERPAPAVAAFAGDPSNAPVWYRRISTAEWETGPPVRIGSRVRFAARFLGRDLAYTYEIVELEPDRRLLMTTAQGPFPMTTEYTWTATAAGGTRMTLRNHGEPAGFSRVVAPVMSWSMRRAMNQDLQELKRQMEAT